MSFRSTVQYKQVQVTTKSDAIIAHEVDMDVSYVTFIYAVIESVRRSILKQFSRALDFLQQERSWLCTLNIFLSSKQVRSQSSETRSAKPSALRIATLQYHPDNLDLLISML